MLHWTLVGIAERLQGSFRQGLALPSKCDVTNADSTKLRQWDSVAHLQLVVAIEDEFGIRLTPADVVELKSYPAAVAILRRHGVAPDA
jgi:acyl carrier protein